MAPEPPSVRLWCNKPVGRLVFMRLAGRMLSPPMASWGFELPYYVAVSNGWRETSVFLIGAMPCQTESWRQVYGSVNCYLNLTLRVSSCSVISV